MAPEQPELLRPAISQARNTRFNINETLKEYFTALTSKQELIHLTAVELQQTIRFIMK